MGYKTKSMIYAKSLKANLNATSEKGNPQAEAFKSIGLGYAKTNTPERSNIEKKMTSKPVSLIKKAPETKAEPTKREKRKSAKKGVDSGVLSGLAGSKGTQTGTAIGIIANKIAGAVKGKKSKAADAVAKAKATSDANIAKGLSITPGGEPIKKADNFRFYEDSGTNKPIPKKSKPISGDLSKMASGSQERIAEYKKRNWAMDATTGGTVKKSKVVKAKTAQKPTGNAATENSLKNKNSIGRPGPSNIGTKVKTIKPTGKIGKPGKSNVNTPKKKGTKEGSVSKSGNIYYDGAWRTKSAARNRKAIQDTAKGAASLVNSVLEVAGPFGDKGWFSPGGKKVTNYNSPGGKK